MSSVHMSEAIDKYGTVCPRNSEPFYVVTYYIKWVTTSWTYSIRETGNQINKQKDGHTDRKERKTANYHKNNSLK